MTAAPPPAVLVADALARLARSRDATAWAALIDALGEDLARTCAAIAGRDLGQDALQETLIRLRDRAGRFQAPAQGDRERAARGWARRVATTTALELVRSRKRARRRDEHAATTAMSDDPAQLSADHERDALVRRELAALPRDQREAVTLHYLLGTPLAEVAAAEGIAVEAAKKRAQRGAERLRRRLARVGLALSLPALGAVLVDLGAAEAVFDRGPSLAALASPAAPAIGALKGAIMAFAIALPLVVAATLITAEQRAPLPPGSTPPPKAAPAKPPYPDVDLDFQDTDLADAAQMMATLSGRKITVASDVKDPPPVTLKVQKMRLDRALDFICQLSALHWRAEKNGDLVIQAATP